MFIRRTKTRTTASGEHYYSYRLVDSYRVDQCVCLRSLLNLGSGFSFPREQWPELSQRIAQIVFELYPQGAIVPKTIDAPINFGALKNKAAAFA